MKPYISLMVSLMITQSLFAQDFNADVDNELDQVSVEDISTTEAQAYQEPKVVTKAQRRLQKQPVTYVEATPLSDSRAEQMRRARQDAELETEQKIVEKLETSRMEDEKKRAEALFGDRLTKQPEVAPVADQPVMQEVHVVQDPSPVQQEVNMSLEDEKIKGKDKTVVSSFSGLVGFGEYPSVDNVKSNLNVGFSYGRTYDDHIVLEGSFLYSNFSIDSYAPTVYANYWNNSYTYNQNQYAYNPYVGYSGYSSYVPAKIDVKQYSAQISGKYRFAEGIIKPTIGGIVQYAYRDYSWAKSYYQYYYYNNNQSASSHAIDGALSLGADLDIDDSFVISLDYRYFKNLMSSSNDSRLYEFYSPQARNPLEKLDYYNIMLGLKINL